MAKILTFRQRVDEDKSIFLKLKRFLHRDISDKVTKLIPKDVAKKLEMPKPLGKKISCFREFVNYFALKKYDEDDELHEFFNKIDIAFLTPEEYDIFKEFYDKDFDWDKYLSTMIAYENSAVNMYRSCGDSGKNQKIVAYARTKYYFSKMMLYLFEERVKILN